MTERNIFREKARVAVRRNKANMKANAMTYRAAIIEECARIAENACLVPPDGGSPTDAEQVVCRVAARQIRALAAVPPAPTSSFQARVKPWLDACFGPQIAIDKVERNHRFIEEALELVQSTGCTQNEAHQLVDYVYGRPAGDVEQEVGGVMNTLAALCLAHGRDMHTDGETELARVWTKIDKIRVKQAAKPKHSPLPEAAPPPIPERDKLLEALKEAIGSIQALGRDGSETYKQRVTKESLASITKLESAIAALEGKS